jgi:hypothetical protein
MQQRDEYLNMRKCDCNTNLSGEKKGTGGGEKRHERKRKYGGKKHEQAQ